MVAPIIDHKKAATASDMCQKRLCASGTYQTQWLKATTVVVAFMMDHEKTVVAFSLDHTNLKTLT